MYLVVSQAIREMPANLTHSLVSVPVSKVPHVWLSVLPTWRARAVRKCRPFMKRLTFRCFDPREGLVQIAVTEFKWLRPSSRLQT